MSKPKELPVDRRQIIGAPGDSAAALAGLRDGLKALGHVEPATLRIEARFAEGDKERVQDLITAIEATGVDVMVAHAQATVHAAKARRQTPLIYSLSADPVTVRLAADLAHPLHNATGVTLMAAELNVKRLELLHEIASTLNPHRALAVRNAKSSAPLPAHQRKSNPGNELRSG
jgi:ABC-type uncharacterized transport system substrate-binding protein